MNNFLFRPYNIYNITLKYFTLKVGLKDGRFGLSRRIGWSHHPRLALGCIVGSGWRNITNKIRTVVEGSVGVDLGGY